MVPKAFLRSSRSCAANTRSIPAGLGSLREALEHFATAVELDPDFAQAWLCIAKDIRPTRSDWTRSVLSEAALNVESYIDKALDINPSLGPCLCAQSKHTRYRADSRDRRPGADRGKRTRCWKSRCAYSPNDPYVLRAYAASMCNLMEKDYDCHARKAGVLKEVIRRDPRAIPIPTWTWAGRTLPSTEATCPGVLFAESVRQNPDFIPGLSEPGALALG